MFLFFLRQGEELTRRPKFARRVELPRAPVARMLSSVPGVCTGLPLSFARRELLRMNGDDVLASITLFLFHKVDKLININDGVVEKICRASLTSETYLWYIAGQ